MCHRAQFRHLRNILVDKGSLIKNISIKKAVSGFQPEVPEKMTKKHVIRKKDRIDDVCLLISSLYLKIN